MKKIISVFLVILLAFNLTVVTYAMPGYVQSVEISGDETITMYVGDELTLEATATPVGFDFSYMIWTISDQSVISLIGDDGTTEFEPPFSTATITAVSEGTAIVTVYADLALPETEDYTTHDFITINVLPKENTSSLRKFSTFSYNNSDKRVRQLSCVIESLNDDIVLDMENMSIAPEQSLYDSEYNLLVLLDLKATDENNPYPQIEETAVNLGPSILGGGTSQRLGKNYKAFLIAGDNKEEISVTEIDDYNITFSISKLGKYVIYFDEYDEYVVNFYSEIPPENSEESNYIYHKIENLQANDIVIFPEIPEKENYVFTGWKVQSGSGIYFAEPQPFSALNNNGKYYASWCLEDEYEPIKLEISSSETITKGKENGKKITLKTNYGIFVEDTEFPTEWRTAYDTETDEQTKADILSEWKSKWNIVGSDDLLIETATRIDDKTIEFTLSGNSNDAYSNADIYIEFDNSLLLPEPYVLNGETIDWDDTKIKMDTDGVRAKMYRSDNAVTLSKQSRPSTNGSGGGTTTYIVKFDTIGGNTISSKTVTRNSKVAEPTAPVKDGYSFTGWFTDEELTEAYDFDKAVTKSFTLYAKWEKHDDDTDDKTDEKTDTPVWKNPFTDVESDDWYYADVEYAVENGLFNGTTSSTFVPDGIITRGMMVAILYRAESEPEITGTTTFDDVDSKEYYANAIVWAQQNGIVNGVSENEFAPDKNITREQIAAIMFRYAQYKGVAPTGAWAIRLDYADLAEISDYAVEGVMYCKLAEIMQGKGNNSFEPQDNATRAEIAAIIRRFIEANK